MQSIIIAIILSVVSSSPAPQGLGLLNNLNSRSTSGITSGNSDLSSGSTSDLASSAGQSSNGKGIETGFSLGTNTLLSSNSQNRGVLSGLLGQKGIGNNRGIASNLRSSDTASGISQTGLNSFNPSAESLRTNSRPEIFHYEGPSNSIDLNGKIRKGPRRGSSKRRIEGRPRGIKFNSFASNNKELHRGARHGSQRNSFMPHHDDKYDQDFSDDEEYYHNTNHRRPSHYQDEEIYLVEEHY